MPYVIPPLLHTIRREADMIAPTRSHASDGTIGDPAHASRTSDHNPDLRGIVHAIDLTHDPRHGFDARSEGEALRNRCRNGDELRVKYLVSYDDVLRHDIIASDVQAWAWRKQRGRDHATHLHISIRSGSDVETSTAQMLRPQLALTAPATPAPTNAHIVGGCVVLEGYYVVSNTGAVYAYGPPYAGGWNGMPRNADVVGIAPFLVLQEQRWITAGYWLAAADGGVLSFGYASFYGSLGGKPLNAPIVGIAATETGLGYYLFGSDGGIFSFGDAPFRGAPVGVVA